MQYVAVVCQSPRIMQLMNSAVPEELRQHVKLFISDGPTSTSYLARAVVNARKYPTIVLYEEYQRVSAETLMVREASISRGTKVPVIAMFISWAFMQTDPFDLDVALKCLISGGDLSALQEAADVQGMP